MSSQASYRKVNLIDGCAPGRPFVEGKVFRDFRLPQLNSVEARWKEAREQIAHAARKAGFPRLEHAHWDWRGKMNRSRADQYLLMAVECMGEIQGLMAVLRKPLSAQIGHGKVAYIDYIESAPWNLKGYAKPPRFIGVGTVLMVEAVRLSVEMGLGGRVGLHSLPQAEPFYSRCRMTELGPDSDYHDLSYFEYNTHEAIDWLATIGVVL